MQEAVSSIWIQAVNAVGTYRKQSMFLVIHKKPLMREHQGLFGFCIRFGFSAYAEK